MKPDLPEGTPLEKGLSGPLFFEGIETLKEDSLLALVLHIAVKRGQSLYLVGGMVRNICLGRPLPNDFDFVYEGETAGLADEVADALGGSAFLLDKDNGLYRVAIKADKGGRGGSVTMDFLPLRYPSIDDDLRERDFTMNAMAISLIPFFEGRGGDGLSLIDPLGGLGDCEKRALRLVSGEKTLRQDPLRCLRGVRLAQQYGLRIESEAEDRIRECAPRISQGRVSMERIRDELELIFAAHGTSGALCRLRDLGLLNVIMPALAPCRDPGLPIFTLKTLGETEKLTREIEAGVFPHRPLEMKRVFEGRARGPSVAVLLKLAAFFHDIAMNSPKAGMGKGREKTECEKGLALSVLKELTFGNKTVRAVKGLLASLHRWSDVPLSASGSPVLFGLLLRLAKEETGLAPPVFVALAIAEVRAEGKAAEEARLKSLYAMLDYYFHTLNAAPSGALFSGVEIMRNFKVPQGEGVGFLKKQIEKAILTGEIRDKKDALSYIKKWIDERWG